VVDGMALDKVCTEGREECKLEMALEVEEWFELFEDLLELGNDLEVCLEEREVVVVLIMEEVVEALVGSVD